jgi:CoA:oxalate CoA-transferase
MILQGIRVLDFSHVLAGPHCGRQLADMGAEVIKVESPGLGDSTRRVLGTATGESNPIFENLNAGKLGFSVDLKRPEGRAVMLELVKVSDVIIENFRPGVMQSFGLDYATLAPLNPKLVMCSISAFGQTGPLAAHSGFAYSATAMSGAMDLDRGHDGRPHVSHLPTPDFLAGLNAVAAIGFALLDRHRTGRGQYLDISLLDCMLAAEDLATPRVLNGGSYAPQRRPGTSVHRVGDGFVVLMMTTDEIFHRFTEAIGKPALRSDDRFATRKDRIANQTSLDVAIEAWIKTFPTRQSVVDFLASHRVPCAPILSIDEAVRHPHALEHGSFSDAGNGPQGARWVVRSAMRFSETPSLPRGPAPPVIGHDTRKILERVLGYSAKAIDTLVATRAVHQA